jgi:predicted nucleic acid-binding protein
MKYLVDANVLSEPTRPAPNLKVVNWLIANEADLAVDSVILGELYVGVLVLSPGRKRAQLEQWFEQIAQTINCIPWDAAVCRRWAPLIADLRRKGEMVPLLDSMIAATALLHGLTMVTRNMRDFKKSGVKVLNPFD